jgi:uncharacterized membrane protein YozB (DUF420 family)
MLVAAVMFTIGLVLAKRKNLVAHRWVQTTAASLNAVLVVFWMIRSFWLYTRPEIPSQLGKTVYAVTTVHAIVGAIGLLVGVFTILQGNGALPRGWRMKDLKPIMRTSYALYMLATLGGIAVYVVAYR